ncbi:uncharacterized protein LOC110724092 [Chenopodium quinoa]|uniref:uncharacterized protein LOC110724092 n=1 Tax=Chenopodium quinoa TaxID=63459 RepID=UPI000B790DCF|nr:uncharacterized protein LOC110724092 [Chenopodium quinoa]
MTLAVISNSSGVNSPKGSGVGAWVLSGVSGMFKVSLWRRGETGNLTSTNPSVFRVTRSNSPVTQQTDATKAEIKRVETLELMKEARALADKNNLEDALNKAVKARNMLEDIDLKKPNSVIETLKQELDEMVKFLQSEETYKNKGRSFACCSETCHDRQRFASRGKDENIRPYATPRMDTYFEQAKEFEKDPSKPLPTAADDEKQELLADPLAGIAPSLSHYLEVAIDALKNIQRIVNQRPKV